MRVGYAFDGVFRSGIHRTNRYQPGSTGMAFWVRRSGSHTARTNSHTTGTGFGTQATGTSVIRESIRWIFARGALAEAAGPYQFLPLAANSSGRTIKKRQTPSKPRLILAKHKLPSTFGISPPRQRDWPPHMRRIMWAIFSLDTRATW